MKLIQKLLAVSAVFLLLFALSTTAFAGSQSSVSYVGGGQKFSFAPGSSKSTTDLFDAFKGVMPGDTLTQQIVVKNETGSNDVSVVLSLRSVGAKNGTDEFLSQLTLTVKKVGGSGSLFNAPADQPAQLASEVQLAKLAKDETVTLELTLQVPATLGNEFQNAVGYIDWEFKAKEVKSGNGGGGDSGGGGGGGAGGAGGGTVIVIIPTEKDPEPSEPVVVVDPPAEPSVTPVVTPGEPSAPVTPVVTPEEPVPPYTGDNTHIYLYFILLIVSGAVFCATLFSRKKQK